jgi:hypothetical protein
MAAELITLTGATAKFRDFILMHMPPPPTDRPPAIAQINWQVTSIRKILNIVYRYRSKALHGGIPFPDPMCGIPWHQPDWKAPAERPLCLAAASRGGVWEQKDLPLHLHVFAHIVRGSLVKWWRGLPPAIMG